MVHSMMNEKSKLNVAAILKAEQEYHEAKAMVDYIDKMPAAMDKLTSVDSEVKELRQEFQKFSKEVVAALGKLEARLNSVKLEAGSSSGQGQQQQQQPAQKAGGDAKNAGQAKKDDKQDQKKDDKKDQKKDDDDVDLFGSDDDDEEADKAREERLAAAAKGKKSTKPAIIAKSMIILDVKPWDDETDVQEMEKKVRSIEADGLVWGTSKFVEVAYGIKKLQITTVVEDDKIGTDWLEEQITGFEDYVQSIDIVAFNKI